MTATVVTFYSFKGGVGRTQALANVALGLACAGKRVIAVDMDLESPGLHFFFPAPDGEAASGVLEFLETCFARPDEPPDVLPLLQRCASPLLPEGAGSIRLLRAGRFSEDYAARLARFSWEDFYVLRGGHQSVEYLRAQLIDADADYVLIDSRTGVTDVGSVCTLQLPEMVLVFFALHEQGLDGAEQVIRAIRARREASGTRVRRVVAVPSRVDETGEDALRDGWLDRVQGRLGGAADDVLVEVGRRIPHMSRAAFGEYLADPSQPKASYLQGAYAGLVKLLAPDAVATTRGQGAPRTLAICDRTITDMERVAAEMAHGGVPIDRIVPWAERLSAGAATLTRETRSLSADVARAHELLELPWTLPSFAPPNTVGAWRKVLDALRGGVESLRAADVRAIELARTAFGPGEPPPDLLARALQPLREGQLATFAEVWPGALSDLRHSSPLAAFVARDVTLQEFNAWFPGGRLRQWIELLLQNAMEARRGASPLSEDRTLLNLLRLAINVDLQPRPLYGSAYALALDGASPVLSSTLFHDVGATLWPRFWLAVIEGSGTVEEDQLEDPAALAQLDAIAADDSALMVGVRVVSEALLRQWTSGDTERIRALLRRHAGHRYLREAVCACDVASAGAFKLAAALLDAQHTMGTSVAPQLVEHVGEGIAAEGMVAEAFYLLCGEGVRSPPVLAGDTFAALTAAFALRARRHGRTDLVEDLLAYDDITTTIARAPIGALWLAWVAVGLDAHAWADKTRAAARRAVEPIIASSQVPEALRALLMAKKPEALIAVRDALLWDELCQKLDERIEAASVLKSLGLPPIYERSFKKYWGARLKPYTTPEPSHNHSAAAFERAIVDDVLRLARDENHNLGALAQSARDSLSAVFKEVHELATILAVVVSRVPPLARAMLSHRRDAAHAARAATSEWMRTFAATLPTWHHADLRAATLGDAP